MIRAQAFVALMHFVSVTLAPFVPVKLIALLLLEVLAERNASAISSEQSVGQIVKAGQLCVFGRG